MFVAASGGQEQQSHRWDELGFVVVLATLAGVQSLLAFYIWGNKATAKGILGIFLVLVGSGAYGWVQMNESIKPAPAPISAAINTGTVELPKV
jgi:drug/metabolite transporter (DMT)-like permease